MRIAILYICTGKYSIFWKDFYKSSEEYFISGAQKKYFVFTDAPRIECQNNPNVKKIYQEDLGWPNNTLRRYEMFSTILMKSPNSILFFISTQILYLSSH